MAKILVVDDDASIRLLCRVNLMAEGFDVIEAASADEALRLVESDRPDLVVLDVMLPGATGLEIAADLSADEQTEQLPIIFLSARAELRDRERGLQAGGLDYLVKPFNPLTLVSAVKETLLAAAAEGAADLRRSRLAELHELMNA